MDVLTSEICWALNNEIIKQLTSSWSLFIQLHMCWSFQPLVFSTISNITKSVQRTFLLPVNIFCITLAAHFLHWKEGKYFVILNVNIKKCSNNILTKHSTKYIDIHVTLYGYFIAKFQINISSKKTIQGVLIQGVLILTMGNDIFGINYSQQKNFTSTEKIINEEDIMTATNQNNLISTYGWPVS